jgi:hypothetical protein
LAFDGVKVFSAYLLKMSINEVKRKKITRQKAQEPFFDTEEKKPSSEVKGGTVA